ncbi:MAG: sigma factor-like helix-turn-helix DNA-binding protein [Paenisporosarcina sp.]
MARWAHRPTENAKVWDEDRARRMLSAYVNDEMTLEQISVYHEISRERVRQIMMAFDPGKYKVARMRRKAAIKRQNNLNQWRKTRAITKTCPICGETFMTSKNSNQVYCSPKHQQLWVLLRYQISEEHREKALRSIARWTVVNSDNVHQVRYSINKLNQTVGEHGSHRAGARYLQPGSLSFHWCIRAYALKWPMFDQLHPDVQQQIKEYVDG